MSASRSTRRSPTPVAERPASPAVTTLPLSAWRPRSSCPFLKPRIASRQHRVSRNPAGAGTPGRRLSGTPVCQGRGWPRVIKKGQEKEIVMHRSATRITGSRLDRRALLRGSAAAGAGLAATRYAPGLWTPGASAATNLSVLSPLAPDPAPPGVAEFAMDDFAAWKTANDAEVTYETIAWPQLHDKMATNFASGTHVRRLLHVRLGPRVRAIPDAARRHAAAGPCRRSAAVIVLDRYLGWQPARSRLHPLAADALLQHGASGRGRSERAADDLGRVEGLRAGADPRWPLRLGAQLR